MYGLHLEHYEKNNYVVFFFLTVFVSAQKELWGVTQQTLYADEQGNIVKFDMNGEHAVTKHHFNYTRKSTYW